MADSGRWHVVHKSEFPHEQEALDLLRERLPGNPPFRGWSNFEFIAEDGSINEVDALVVSSDCIYLIEIKNWHGTITGNQNTWKVTAPNGRQRTEDNPLLLTNRKAKKLKSLLARQSAFKKTRVPFIQAAIFLSAPDCTLKLDDIARQHIYLRPDADRKGEFSITDVINGRASEADNRPRLGRDTERATVRAMDEIGLRKPSGDKRVGDYVLTQLLGENDRYQDWEIQHAQVDSDRKRARIFPHAQQASDADKRERKDIATREYELLREVRHDHILSPIQLTESEAGPALIYDYDPNAQRLDHLLQGGDTSLNLDQRLELVRQIAEALGFAHQKGICHRALSPFAIEVTQAEAGSLFARLRDWQSGASDVQTQTSSAMTLHVGEATGTVANPRAAVYAPPEVISGHGYDAQSIDLFALGALTYAIFSNRPPADDAEQMRDKCHKGPGLLVSEVLDGAPESLQNLIQFATDPDPIERPADVRKFLSLLNDVEDELTSPEPESGVPAADARNGDRLSEGVTGTFTVQQRLGSGSTCYALAVGRSDGQSGVLKIAKEPSLNNRLQDEAAALQELHHANIVRLLDQDEIDGCAALFVEQAGDQTLGQRLRHGGALSLDLLERFGEELIGALVYLERNGINHRDIKPENIGIGENRKRALTLKLFDFSLSRAPLDNIRAGTSPYLDPFLCKRKPPRWDLHAERFAAGMTLHELATGTLPTWGSAGQDPASTDDEASLETEALDPFVRDSLTHFFRKVLRRDYRERFDNADEMYLAWRQVFQNIDQTTHEGAETGTASEPTDDIDLASIDGLSRTTTLAALGLSARLLNAAERIGVTKVGELLDAPGIRFYRNRGIGQRQTRRLRELREQLADRLDAPASYSQPEASPDHYSIDRLLHSLEGIQLSDIEADIISAWLGHDKTSAQAGELPDLREVAEDCGAPRSAVQAAIDKAADKWARNKWMTTLRLEAAEFVTRREGIVTVPELATHLLTRHGSTAAGAERQRRAAAVVQAVLEVEAQRESARFVLSRRHNPLLVTATDYLGQAFGAAPGERAEYARALASQAEQLAGEDPLPSPQRNQETLAAIAGPADDQPMSPERRLRLAVAAAPGVALSGRLELYPDGMSAERGLRLGANSLLGATRLSVEQLQNRIRSRFSHAQPLPGRPELDHLLEDIEFPLKWHEASDGRPAGYAMPSKASGLTGNTSTLSRHTTATHPGLDTVDAQQAQQFEDNMHRAIEQRRVLIVTCSLKRLDTAADALASQFELATLSLDRLIIDNLYEQAQQIDADWRVVLNADTAAHNTSDWRNLNALVQRAMPQVQQQLLDDPRPLLIQHLGLLVRYGQMDLLQTLRDAARTGHMPARLLLVPGDPTHKPLLDGTTLPVITPADWTGLPRAWLTNAHRAAGPTAEHA